MQGNRGAIPTESSLAQDQASPPAASQETDDIPARCRETTLCYLDELRATFEDSDPVIYQSFLDLVSALPYPGTLGRQLDYPGVCSRIMELFQGHTNLILGFNHCLPEAYKIIIPSSTVEPDPEKVVMKQQAMAFKRKVQALGTDMYREFHVILRLYKIVESSIDGVDKMAETLFAGDDELLNDLRRFLPPPLEIPNNEEPDQEMFEEQPALEIPNNEEPDQEMLEEQPALEIPNNEEPDQELPEEQPALEIPNNEEPDQELSEEQPALEVPNGDEPDQELSETPPAKARKRVRFLLPSSDDGRAQSSREEKIESEGKEKIKTSNSKEGGRKRKVTPTNKDHEEARAKPKEIRPQAREPEPEPSRTSPTKSPKAPTRPRKKPESPRRPAPETEPVACRKRKVTPTNKDDGEARSKPKQVRQQAREPTRTMPKKSPKAATPPRKIPVSPRRPSAEPAQPAHRRSSRRPVPRAKHPKSPPNRPAPDSPRPPPTRAEIAEILERLRTRLMWKCRPDCQHCEHKDYPFDPSTSRA